MKISIFVFTLILFGCTFILNDGVVIGVSYRLGKGKAYLAYPTIIDGVQNAAKLAVANLISPMVTTSLTIKETNLNIKNCNLSLDDSNYYQNFNYNLLISNMNSLIKQPNTIMQSIGVISVDNAGNNNADFSNKVSCELALDTFNLGCTDYVYACTDNSSSFVGYCGFTNNTINFNQIVYSGQDSGLTDQEKQLFTDKTIKAIFLPIFNLLGKLSLTYEISHWCPGDVSAYAATFAQKNLDQLHDYLSTLSIGKTGVVYLIDYSGLLVSSSIEEAVQNNSRVPAIKAKNRLISQSSKFLLSKGNFSSFTSNTYFKNDGLLIDIRPIEYNLAQAELGWISIVVIPASDYAGWITTNAKWSILTGILISLFCLSIILIMVNLCINRPLKDPTLPTNILEIHRNRELLLHK